MSCKTQTCIQKLQPTHLRFGIFECGCLWPVWVNSIITQVPLYDTACCKEFWQLLVGLLMPGKPSRRFWQPPFCQKWRQFRNCTPQLVIRHLCATENCILHVQCNELLVFVKEWTVLLFKHTVKPKCSFIYMEKHKYKTWFLFSVVLFLSPAWQMCWQSHWGHPASHHQMHLCLLVCN